MIIKGRALRRALGTADVGRVNTGVPLITDTTELITPTIAQEMLKRNKRNRPINWKKVEEYADIMARGEWELHAQGVVMDPDGNVLTGQKRLWAVVYSDTNVYMRVSRGNPSSVARLLDRGTPQTSRDLASRGTGRKHSPTEASIARAYCALMGNTRPTVDQLAITIEVNQADVSRLLISTAGTKKTKPVIMVLAAICVVASDCADQERLATRIERMTLQLETELLPQLVRQCWGRGAAFGLAMDITRKIVEREKNRNASPSIPPDMGGLTKKSL